MISLLPGRLFLGAQPGIFFKYRRPFQLGLCFKPSCPPHEPETIAWMKPFFVSYPDTTPIPK
jgi:hypothetical protein